MDGECRCFLVFGRDPFLLYDVEGQTWVPMVPVDDLYGPETITVDRTLPGFVEFDRCVVGVGTGTGGGRVRVTSVEGQDSCPLSRWS